MAGNSPHRLAKAGEEYYTKLFEAKKTVPEAAKWLRDQLKAKLSEKAKKILDEPLQKLELINAMKAMRNNKAPGLDGMPIELYKAIPDMLDGVISMWNEALKEGALSESAKNGKLVIIHKKDDKENLKNYRPLTLMNSDYKIIAKALATRLASVISEVVGTHQSGFIKGRNIKYNIMEAHLVTRYSNRNSQGAIILLDFEKAYDRVNRDWLWDVMKDLGFGEPFITMMRVLHEGATIVLCLNTATSGKIPVASGVRQGCPIAPLLFAITQSHSEMWLAAASCTKG
jgi:hypothetical protein